MNYYQIVANASVCYGKKFVTLNDIDQKPFLFESNFTIVNWRNEYMTGSDHFSAFKYENIIIECNELI